MVNIEADVIDQLYKVSSINLCPNSIGRSGTASLLPRVALGAWAGPGVGRRLYKVPSIPTCAPTRSVRAWSIAVPWA
jgi:hypothetical protein